jgi:hypothetical protein
MRAFLNSSTCPVPQAATDNLFTCHCQGVCATSNHFLRLLVSRPIEFLFQSDARSSRSLPSSRFIPFAIYSHTNSCTVWLLRV